VEALEMTRDEWQARRGEALRRLHVKYAIRFALESGGALPSDGNLKRVLDRCVRPARAAEYPRIRVYVHAYRADRETFLRVYG
jgi:hypothetical protein